MSKSMHDFKFPAEAIAERLAVLMVLSRVLEKNIAFRDAADEGEHPAMIDGYGEDGIVRAIRLIASDAHQGFCRLATDLGIPE
ncbi:hypothetical protein N7650_14930 [Pseudomonas sp. GD04058]|nr:hypothetical protein [Pseudomonas sp. GD04058]MDG9884132.1 hypothetical protein [Pseudomonas sp. GD04058]